MEKEFSKKTRDLAGENCRPQSGEDRVGQQTVTRVAVRAIPALRDQFRWFIRVGFMGQRQDRGRVGLGAWSQGQA